MTTVRFYPSREPRLLWAFSMKSIFATCMICPIAALFLSFTLGATFHPLQLFKYRWTCDAVHLPSVSRVINMSLERTIFQILVLSSVPFRLLVLCKHWLEHSTLEASRYFIMARKLMTVSGLTDVVFLSLLSVIGERENGDIHVALFAGFATASYVYFVCLCLLTRWTFNGSKSEVLRAKLQLTFLASVTVTIPIIALLFILYNAFCVPLTYELFAVFEYTTVLAMFAFHATSYSRMTGHVYMLHSSIKSRTQRV